QLGAATEPDEEGRRPRRQGQAFQSLPPVFALHSCPVAIPRKDGQGLAGDDEPPLAQILDDTYAPGNLRPDFADSPTRLHRDRRKEVKPPSGFSVAASGSPRRPGSSRRSASRSARCGALAPHTPRAGPGAAETEFASRATHGSARARSREAVCRRSP